MLLFVVRRHRGHKDTGPAALLLVVLGWLAQSDRLMTAKAPLLSLLKPGTFPPMHHHFLNTNRTLSGTANLTGGKPEQRSQQREKLA